MAIFRNNTKFEGYLLGELPEAEQEALEENLFVDDELFEALQAAEMALVDRYVRNAMSGSERRKMDAKYIVTPERRAKIAEAKAFHKELEAIRPQEAKAENVSWLANIFGGWSLATRQMQYAAAGLIAALALAVGWLAYDRAQTQGELAEAQQTQAERDARLRDELTAKETELAQELEQQRTDEAETLTALQQEIELLERELAQAKERQPDEVTEPPTSATPRRPSLIERVPLPAMRPAGAGRPLIVAIEEGTRVISLDVELGELEGDTFAVTITKGDEAILRIKDTRAQVAGGRRYLLIALPATLLGEGSYDLLIRNASGDEKKQALTVVRK